jgi:hypothetical protein
MRDQRLDLPRVAVAGSRGAVERARRELAERGVVPFEPVFLPDYSPGRAAAVIEEPDRAARLVESLRAERIAGVYFVSPEADVSFVGRLVPLLARAGIRSHLRPSFAPLLNPEVRVLDFGGTWVLSLGARTRWRAAGFGKRAVDLAGSGTLLVLGAPWNLLFLLARWLGRRRPLFSTEERWVGSGTPVTCRLYHPRPRRKTQYPLGRAARSLSASFRRLAWTL